MKRIALLWAVGAAAALAFAPMDARSQTAPTTQQRPAEGDGQPSFRQPGERRFGDGRGTGGFGGPGAGGAGDGMRPRGEWRRGDFANPVGPGEPSEEEWKEITAFMKAHSPKRLERIDEIGDEQRQQGVRNMFAARYRAMQDLKERDPDLYKVRLERLPIEDEVFTLSWELAHSKTDKGDAERDKLRQLMRRLVKSRLDERTLRLKQAERRIELERERLKNDEQRIDALVEANLADIAAERLPRDLRPQLNPPRRDRRGDDNGPGDADAVE